MVHPSVPASSIDTYGDCPRRYLYQYGYQLYDDLSPYLRMHQTIREAGAQVVIPSKSNRTKQRPYDEALYKARNLIERFFCKLKQFRRIATSFDKLARNFLAAVLIASTRLWLRAYESTP